MKFSTVLALVAAPLAVFAQSSSGTGSAATASAAPVASGTSSGSNPNPFKVPTSGISGEAGQSLTLNWTPTTSGDVSLYLRQGSSNDLDQGTELAADIPNSGSYTLTIPADTVRGSDYTIEIRSASGGSNYTPYFVIESTITVASTTASSASASSTASGSMTSGSMTSSASASGKSSSSASGSKTTSGSSTSTSGAAFQSASSSASSGNSAPRATAAAGMMGLVALGALAL